MLNTILVLTIIFLSRVTVAHEDSEDILNEKNVVQHEIYDIRNSKAKIHVIVRNDGHTLGKPFVVEVRPDCKGDGDWATLPVVDTESACDVSLGATKMNKAGNEIIITLRGPNKAAYNSGSLKVLKSEKPLCSSETKEQKFNLASFCK